MRRLLKASLLAAMGWAVATPASAATFSTLQIVDTFNGSHTTYNLTVQTGCTSDCSVTLTADYDNWDFAGIFLQSIQWKVDGYTPSNISLDTTNAGATTDWLFKNGVVNQGGCQFISNQDAVCGDWIGTGDGFPVAEGDSLEWTFTVDWDQALALTGLTGNVRAAYSYANGQNFHVFSPGGGTFETTENVEITDLTENVEITPEPATLVLFGSGLAIAAARLRRRRQNENV
jgi:PEP-CTERM motif